MRDFMYKVGEDDNMRFLCMRWGFWKEHSFIHSFIEGTSLIYIE